MEQLAQMSAEEREAYLSWRPKFEPLPNLRMTFGRFLKDEYDGRHNLYIIWRGKQALYIGITKDHISNRWFHKLDSHMRIVYKDPRTGQGGHWVGSSTIGSVIQLNYPKSLKWIIELREYSTFSLGPHEKLEDAEKRLIHELRPLFNITYRQELSDKEQRLYEKLLPRVIIDLPDDFIPISH
jgi:hypothetical protein